MLRGWAMGKRGTVLHLRGSQPLSSVWGSGPRDVFAAGRGGIVLHYDGIRWRRMASGTNHNLHGIWGDDRRNILAVGQSGYHPALPRPLRGEG